MRVCLFAIVVAFSLGFSLAQSPTGLPSPGQPPSAVPPTSTPGQPAPGQPPRPPGDQPPVPLPPGSPPPQPPGSQAPPGTKAPGTPAAAPAAAPPIPVKAEDSPRVVRVNVTNQAWDFSRPWGKRAPFTRRAVGAILPGKRVLVSAELVANANYLELESAEGANRTPASIIAVDYECNLALLKGDDDEFLTSFKPLDFTEAKVGDTLHIWQLETTGVVLATQGPMTTAEVARYPADDSAFLTYRATAALQFRDSSFNLPVLKDGKLAGMLVRYDNASNSAEIVPSPVIKHFMKDAEEPPYEGFPRTGIAYSATRDPQLRRYVGLTGKHQGGVYVTDLQKDSPGAKADIKPGDVILSVDDQPIDQDGNYVDPTYGKLAFSHLISTQHFDGERVRMKVLRKGELLDVEVKIAHRDVKSYVIEPYVIDRPPKFFMLGGLILQELSRQYLKEFGKEWEKRAPQELVYLDRYQSDLFKDGQKKVVILSRVLPMASTVGYEELHHLVVERINGFPLMSLEDVPNALTRAVNGTHKIEFDSEPRVIYLDANIITAEEPALVQNYRLPATQRLVE